MQEVLAQLVHRKLRTFLTICGFAIGIFSVLSIGAMAEKFRSMGQHLERLFSGKVFICEKVSFWAGGGILSESCVPALKKTRSSSAVIPFLVTRLRERQMFYLGFPEVVVGLPPEETAAFCENPPLLSGRWLRKGDDSALIGFEVARSLGLSPGRRLKLRHRQFPVAGVLERTGSIEDRMAFLPLALAQEVFHRPSLLTGIMVKMPPGVEPGAMIKEIHRILPAVETITPDEMKRQAEESLALWNIITVGSAILASLVGALCIFISMLVAIFERRNEIALKKALGASESDIMGEFVLESFLISIVGWILGALSGAIFTGIYDRALQGRGITLFYLSPRLLIISLAGAALLGVIAGLVPAYQAARLRPAEAMTR
ncbi:MAG: ABC transporter permease [bacterium]